MQKFPHTLTDINVFFKCFWKTHKHSDSEGNAKARTWHETVSSQMWPRSHTSLHTIKQHKRNVKWVLFSFPFSFSLRTKAIIKQEAHRVESDPLWAWQDRGLPAVSQNCSQGWRKKQKGVRKGERGWSICYCTSPCICVKHIHVW